MLKEAIGREEVLRAARAQTALRNWHQIVGPLLSERSRPDRFDHGTVWVAVEGSAWAQELRMIKPLILERLCNAAGEQGLFADLRFGVRVSRRQSLEPLEEPEQWPTPDVDPNLTIREIAEKRLASWSNETRNRE